MVTAYVDMTLTPSKVKVKVTGLLNFRQLAKPCMLAAMTAASLRGFLVTSVRSGVYGATLGASLVQSRLDYANSIMYGMSASNMHKLLSVQDSLTRVVLPSLRHLSASERLSYLQLPVRLGIVFMNSVNTRLAKNIMNFIKIKTI